MLGPRTPVLDNFNRSNGSIGSNWTAFPGVGTISIIANTCQSDSASIGLMYWNVSQPGPNFEVYCTLDTKPGDGNDITIYGRLKDVSSITTTDGYLLVALQQSGTDIFRLRSVTNGAASTLGADISQEYTAGDIMMLRGIGSTLEAWLFTSGAWNLLGSRTDSTYGAAGYLALSIVNTTGRADNFGGGALLAAPPEPAARRPLAGLIVR